MPEGFEPGNMPEMPEDFDPSQMFDGEMPEDFDPSQMFGGRGQRPEGGDRKPPEGFEGFDGEMPDGMEPPDGFDPSRIPGGQQPQTGEAQTGFYMNDKVNAFSGVTAAE